MTALSQKPRKDSPINGLAAIWYPRITGNDMVRFRAEAQELARRIKPGASVLEVAPGPGYLAIELAKTLKLDITGLDLSKSLINIARKNAQRAGVDVDFRQGNAARMPFEPDSFDFIVCRAAFKNFAEPVRALDEMHRVLRPGSTAVIVDLRNDASQTEIHRHVDQLRLGMVNSLVTRLVFKHMLLKRAYSTADFEEMAAASRFERCAVEVESIGLEVTFFKSSETIAARPQPAR